MRGKRALPVAAAAGLSVVIALSAASPSSAAPDRLEAVTRTALTAEGALAVALPFPGRSPAAVQSLSVQAMKGAASFHVRMHAVDGQDTTDLDFVVGKTGGRGTVSRTGHGSLHLIRVQSMIYVQGDEAFWRSTGESKEAAALLIGHWVGIKGKNKGIEAIRRQLAPDFWISMLSSPKATQRVPGKTVDKTPTVGLTNGGDVVYVAAKGKPYPLLVEDKDTPDNRITFSEWNKKVTFKAPKVLAVVTVNN
ncbi:MAG TPA: hypothetical protein VI248_04415 [Kineosporiaceae bacterium]